MKVGILITDAVRDELIGQYGDYPDMFENLLLGADQSLDIVRFDVQQAVPDIVDCGGYIITGSRYSVYDDLPWIRHLVDFVRDALINGCSVFCICSPAWA